MSRRLGGPDELELADHCNHSPSENCSDVLVSLYILHGGNKKREGSEKTGVRSPSVDLSDVGIAKHYNFPIGTY